MKLSDYNYDLPDYLIADQPPLVRGNSNLLVLDRSTGEVFDKKYYDVTDYLGQGDVLILNDTKVIKARLNTIKQNGTKRELVLLEKHSFDNDWHRHRVLYRRKLSIGDQLAIGDTIIVIDEILDGGIAIVKSDRDLLEVAEKFGEVPLPPYMHRKATPMDIERYQTIWAEERGSVAAPTASLNMTDEIISKLHSRGVQIGYVTLHVGLGTFLPIRTDNLESHHMHQEYFEIPADTISLVQSAKKSGGQVVALGTTVARTLEYAHDRLTGKPEDISDEADIFIYPGYKFKVIDGLMTNFHAPKSTVLMLTAAFAGWDKLSGAYQHAINHKYNFLSYGDSMLIL